MLSVVGDRNHGTLDNASGVAAVLEAVELLPRRHDVGVLITDAEELALAGATAWARDRRAGVALNCDSVDDDGSLVVMYTGARAAGARVVTRARRVGLRRAASHLCDCCRVFSPTASRCARRLEDGDTQPRHASYAW